MITYHKGDILKSGANVICHQVNCQGVMGSGLAKQIKDQYPEVYKNYRVHCDTHTTQQLMGTMFPFTVNCYSDSQITICNLFGQNYFGRDKIQTDYQALKNSLEDVRCVYYDDIIAIPYKIGCGLAGGSWNIVERMIKNIFAQTSLDVQVWEYQR